MGDTASEPWEAATEAEALRWLSQLDAGDYRASWDRAAHRLKGQMAPETWGEQVAARRAPLGENIARERLGTQRGSAPFGGNEHGQVMVRFESRFEQGQAIENVALTFEDGMWRVAGYVVR